MPHAERYPAAARAWAEQQRWWEHYEQHDNTAFLLRLHLQLCVPLRIADLRARGGPDHSDYARLRGYLVPTDPVQEDGSGGIHSLLCAGAEAILFRTEQGKSAEWVSKLVDAIAVLSFCPGGIDIFGLRWESVA
jgi:hypothetical protein